VVHVEEKQKCHCCCVDVVYVNSWPCCSRLMMCKYAVLLYKTIKLWSAALFISAFERVHLADGPVLHFNGNIFLKSFNRNVSNKCSHDLFSMIWILNLPDKYLSVLTAHYVQIGDCLLL
jgi:hypothetical protein